MNFFTQAAFAARELEDIHHRVIESIYCGNKRTKVPTDDELIQLRSFLITLDRFVAITGYATTESYAAMAANITKELKRRKRARKGRETGFTLDNS